MFGYLRLAFAGLLFASLGACAVGNEHNYASAVPTLQSKGTASLAVAVHDERPYVTSKEKGEDFVGLMRGGFGNPFDIRTESKRPLADDLREAMMAALKSQGFATMPVVVGSALTVVQAREKAVAAGGDKAIFLAVQELKSDSYATSSLRYDLRLSVLDRSGRSLAESAVSGQDDLGGALNIPQHVREKAPPHLRTKLEALLNDPKVVAALQ